MTYRVRNIALAIALALVAALLVTFYVSNYKRRVLAGEANVRVWVASRDIPSGVTGAAAVKQSLLQPQDVARRTVVPGAISDPEQIKSLVATQRVYAGEQVSLRRFGNVTQRGLRGELTGTLRAIQVPGDANQLLVGTLRVGDRVDLVSNIALTNGDHFSRVVVRDVKVLTAPEGVKVDDRVGGATRSVMLAIRDTQVQRFWFAVQNGDWSLQLRPAADASDSTEVVENTQSVYSFGVRRAR